MLAFSTLNSTTNEEKQSATQIACAQCLTPFHGPDEFQKVLLVWLAFDTDLGSLQDLTTVHR